MSVRPFSWVRSARILINNGRRREVGNTAGTDSEDPGFKPTSDRQLFRKNFFLVFLRLPSTRHKNIIIKQRVLVCYTLSTGYDLPVDTA
jgi:hypothetical protein